VPVAHGRPVSVCGESHWAGLWDLEKLNHGEVVDWWSLGGHEDP
jgi:hypothetical protein